MSFVKNDDSAASAQLTADQLAAVQGAATPSGANVLLSTSAGTPIAHGTATTGVHGVGAGTIAKVADIPVKAAGSDIDTGTNDAKFVTPKAIADSAIGDVTAWATFDPTSYITWAVATPAAMTLAGYYRLISGTAEFKVYIVSADPSNNVGKIASMGFPVGWQPKQLSMKYPILGLHRKDTAGANTPTVMAAWLDATQAVAANRVINFINAVVWADNEGTELMFSGSFQYV